MKKLNVKALLVIVLMAAVAVAGTLLAMAVAVTLVVKWEIPPSEAKVMGFAAVTAMVALVAALAKMPE